MTKSMENLVLNSLSLLNLICQRHVFLKIISVLVFSSTVRAATLQVGHGQSYATIQAAVDAASAGDLILVHKGTYREGISINKNNLVIRAFGTDYVLVTGLDRVQSNWEQFKGNIYRTAISNEVTDVFVDGLNMDKARFPNKNANNNRLTYDDATKTTTSASDPSGHATVVFDGMNAPRNYWIGGSYYGRNGPNPWTADCGKIIASDGNNITVEVHNPQWKRTPNGHGIGEGKGYIINSLNALDAPREWHWQDGFLYLCPPKSGDPKHLEVEARTRLYVIKAQDVSGITLSGLNIKAGSILFQNCQNSVIDSCNIRYPGPWSDFDYGHDYGGTKDGTYGVYLSGTNNVIKNCYIARTWGSAVTLDGKGTTCSNCIIEYANWLGRRGGGIHCIGDGCRISHCTVRFVGRDGIDGGNRGGQGSIVYNQIASNLVVDYCNISEVGLLATDCGFFYINTQGAIAANITVHHCVCFENRSIAPSWGLHFDNGTSGILCHHNIIYGVGTAAINCNPSSHQSFDIKLYNNLMLNCKSSISRKEFKKVSNAFTVLNNFTDVNDENDPLYNIPHNLTGAKSADFVDFTHFDFRPSSTSPVIHAGIPIPGITNEKDSKPDIGPYTYGQTTSDWISGSSISVPSFPDEK